MITVKTNASKVIDKLIIDLGELSGKGRIGTTLIRSVAFGQLAEMRRRIRFEGLAADGSVIGQYSRKPAYFSKAGNVGQDFGRPLGKPYNGKRRSVFAGGKKAGQDHLTRYFEKGYYQYKTVIGRNVLGTVNLSLSGNMLDQMNVYPTAKGWGIGWTGGDFGERAMGFQKKYKKIIFGMSAREKELALATIRRQLKNAIN